MAAVLQTNLFSCYGCEGGVCDVGVRKVQRPAGRKLYVWVTPLALELHPGPTRPPPPPPPSPPPHTHLSPGVRHIFVLSPSPRVLCMCGSQGFPAITASYLILLCTSLATRTNPGPGAAGSSRLLQMAFLYVCLMSIPDHKEFRSAFRHRGASCSNQLLPVPSRPFTS